MAHLLDNRQDPWLVLIVSVRSHAQVDLLRERVGLIGRREFENTRVLGKYKRAHRTVKA
jgi:hypothetical protein